MYIVTFYSFKGGTGRSMALANVAVELAMRGKRVLAVDFDLEAPGLDTFPFRKPEPQQKGLVDFIETYIESSAVPDVRDYVYETSPESYDATRLWIMPAGRQDDQYDGRFKAIDWNDLYQNEDGFLLFEDLKAQWQDTLRPDYVLIDSRTGHTDAGGICTRQLPDAVVIFFFPNEQNRRGLKPIVDTIRNEQKEPLNKSIYLHFVMANVPDLDDEEEILAEHTARFRETLGYKDLSATIHHQNSLSMLDQDLFVLERPKSSLSREYKQLSEAIVRQNLQDSHGAVAFLDEAMRNFRSARPTIKLKELEDRLLEIKANHPKDAEILSRLAHLRRTQRRYEESLELLDQLVSMGVTSSDVLLDRADIEARIGRTDLAISDLSRFFALPEAPKTHVSLAVRLQLQLDKTGIAQLAASPALQSLDADGLIVIARELGSVLEALPVTEQLTRRWLNDHPIQSDPESFRRVRIELMLSLIGMGRFADAMTAIRPTRPLPEDLDQPDAFNYAMAEWGNSGIVPADLLNRVLVLAGETPEDLKDPNYHQCLAITHWATGNHTAALRFIDNAANVIQVAPRPAFSAWSYQTVGPERFKHELEEMRSKLFGDPPVPEFIRRANETQMTLLIN
jgi:MinD-like ATPase involved in chromosome partitioning or flagellar assembly